MENRRILIMKPAQINVRRFGDWLVFSLAGLALCGCATSITPEEWRCVDDKGNTLSGVIALYSYTGLGYGPSYSREGGYVVSDYNGILRLPNDTVSKSILDGRANRGIDFMYSEQTHAAYYNQFGNVPVIMDGTKKLNIFHDTSKDPNKWYLSLRILLNAADGATHDLLNPRNFFRRLGPRLVPIANNEKNLFLSRYGQAKPDNADPQVRKDVAEFAREHNAKVSEITFSMLVSALKQ